MLILHTIIFKEKNLGCDIQADSEEGVSWAALQLIPEQLIPEQLIPDI